MKIFLNVSIVILYGSLVILEILFIVGGIKLIVGKMTLDNTKNIIYPRNETERLWKVVKISTVNTKSEIIKQRFFDITGGLLLFILGTYLCILTICQLSLLLK